MNVVPFLQAQSFDEIKTLLEQSDEEKDRYPLIHCIFSLSLSVCLSPLGKQSNSPNTVSTVVLKLVKFCSPILQKKRSIYCVCLSSLTEESHIEVRVEQGGGHARRL